MPGSTTGKYPACRPIRCPNGTHREVSGVQADHVPERHDREVSGVHADHVSGRHDREVSGLQADHLPERHDRELSGLQADRRARKARPGNYPDCKPITCPRGTTGKYPDCKPIVPDCKKNEKLINGKCVRVTGPVICGPNTVLNRKTGKCEPLAPTVSKTCPKGFVGTPPNCKRPPQVCPKGFRRHAAELQEGALIRTLVGAALKSAHCEHK